MPGLEGATGRMAGSDEWLLITCAVWLFPWCCSNGPHVPETQYQRTSREKDDNFLPKCKTVRSYYLRTLAVPLAAAAPCAILCHVRMNVEGAVMDSAYAAWVGLPVVLQVALGDIKVPLRGKLLKDGGDTIRMRIGDGWDVDIYKAMILTVEEDVMGLLHA